MQLSTARASCLALLLTACAGETASGIPCDVERVVADACLRCHGSEPQFDAPYRLLTYDDFFVVHNDKPVHERVAAVVETDYMPPVAIDTEPPIAPLAAADKALLLDWAQAGSPAADRSACE